MLFHALHAGLGRILARAGIVFLLVVAVGAQAGAPKRVLVLHSFSRDFAPYDAIASAFRTDLAQRSPVPITFIEANLDFGRASSEKEQQAFLAFLAARFEGAPPDAVVTLGPPAARFYARHRAELFPGIPLVMGALDQRFVKQVDLQAHDEVVAGGLDIPRLVENVLQLQPATKRIAVVIGDSDLEHFWLGELQRELAPFAGRVRFEWLNDLSLSQMQERTARLPPDSAILYTILIADAAGIPHERLDSLAMLHATANAPMFGIYEAELGKGVVGGPYSSQRVPGEHLATATLRALDGTPSPQPRIDVTGFETPAYDWREIDRWKIDPARLPPGSQIMFKPPSLWEAHRTALSIIAAALVIQALSIAALLLQRVRLRRAEQESRHLSGRILTAQENERRRLAREMHDDVTQRLAALAIDAAKAQIAAGKTAIAGALDDLRSRLVKMSEDVHALSYRLHPSMIEDLGLVAALRAECNRVARNEPLRVDFDAREVPKKIAPGTAICLYRVAQESLRNIVRHADAKNVELCLLNENGGLALSVRDDGRGFDPAPGYARASLGLVSMRERLRLVGGRLEIAAKVGQGTTVRAWVPLEAA